MTLIFPSVNTYTKNLILSELEYFAQGYDKELVKDAVRAIGRCAQSETRNAARCLRVLLRQVESSDGTLVAESLTVIRHIIQQNPATHSKTVIRLARALDTAVNPTARASIIWLVGEFSGMDDGNNVAADTLRLLAKNFPSESDQAKQQIVLLAAKIYAHNLNRRQSVSPSPPQQSSVVGGDDEDEAQKHPIALLFSYILLLARYDISYDLRDRARLYKSLLAISSSTQLATLLLLAPKPTPQAPSPSSGREDLTIGSAAMVLGKEESIRGYEALPDWVSVSRAPSPSLREPPPAIEGATTKGALSAAMAIGSKGSGRSGSPAFGGGSAFGSPIVGSPRFSQLEDRDHGVVAPRSNGKVETSLEDFLASDESEEEDEESESEESEQESEEEESDDEGEEDDEGSSDDDDGKESAQLLGGGREVQK